MTPRRAAVGALSAALLLGAGSATHAGAFARTAPPARPAAVVAVVADTGVDVLHREYATADGRDVDLARLLPRDVLRTVVRVDTGRPGADEDARRELLARGPLGRLAAGALYYVRGTRLLLWAGPSLAGQPLAADFHGTGTTSAAAGRTTGTAPDALLVVALGSPSEAWAFVAEQTYVDVASSSVVALAGLASTSPLCDAAADVLALRQRGALPYVIAGNGFFETLALSPGHSAAAVRVGGVHTDGTPYTGQDEPGNYSSHGYDVAEAWTTLVAQAGTTDGYTEAGGTSGSTPRVAGRAAALLARARQLVGDRGTGPRGGALVVGRPTRAGPLADGRLTADELLAVQLATARPSGTGPARYAVEGYGWFDAAAQARAFEVLRGAAEPPARPDDDRAHDAALLAREASGTARGCGLG